MDLNLFAGLGVGEKSAALYLAGLALGTTTVQELARKAGVKRPTAYLYLDELMKQGLFELVPLNKKTYSRAADPATIEARLAKNLEIVRTELPKMATLRSDMLGKPQVRILEGVENIRQIYEEMRTANSLRVWSNVGAVYGPFHDAYMDLAEAAREQGIGVREIIADTKESRRYARLIAKVAGPSYTARIATITGLENDAIIYGNVVALFRLSGLNLFVVRIEDATIADSMRAMFEMAWRTARPFK